MTISYISSSYKVHKRLVVFLSTRITKNLKSKEEVGINYIIAYIKSKETSQQYHTIVPMKNLHYFWLDI